MATWGIAMTTIVSTSYYSTSVRYLVDDRSNSRETANTFASEQAAAVARTPAAGEPDNPEVTALGFLNSTAFADTAPWIRSAFLRIFGESEALRDAFASIYRSTMVTEGSRGICSDNAQHNALYETIMRNRSSFPSGSFKIRTEMPGGGSIETEIPPSQDFAKGADVSSSARPLSAAKVIALMVFANCELEAGGEIGHEEVA